MRSERVWSAIVVLMACSPFAAAGELRTYDVRDLLIEIPDYTPAGVAKPTEPLTPAGERMAAITAIVRGAMSKESADAAEFRELKGQLILDTDAAGHDAAKRVLDRMRSGRGLQVMIECRMVRPGEAGWAALDSAVRDRLLAAALDPARAQVDLSADESKTAWDAIAAAGGALRVAAPRLTLFNSQWALFKVTDETPVNGQLGYLQFDVRAVTAADGSSTAVSLDYERSDTHAGRPRLERLNTLGTTAKGRTLAYVLPDAADKPKECTLLLLTATPIVQREVAGAMGK